jgi:glutamine synthetase
MNTKLFIQKIKGQILIKKKKKKYFILFLENNLNSNSKIDNKKSILNQIEPISLTTLVTTDLIGITRGRSIPTSEVEKYYEIGCGWVPANSALTPQNEIVDSNPWGSQGDLRLLPDKNSRVRINNGPDPKSTPFDYIHCDIIETNGNQWNYCPRTLLKNEIQFYLENLEMKINVSFEHEFTLFDQKQNLISQPSFSLRAQRQQNQFASWLISSLQTANVQPEMFLPEFGQNQYEITCYPSDPLTAADRAVNIREITREIARQMNLNVTFSPLTSVNSVSNGVHLHISIDDLHGKSLFYDKDRPYNLSLIGEYWSAGILHHLGSLCALTAPTPVSYLRLKPHHWSSAYTCVGYRNREAPIRICPTIDFGGKSVSEQYNLEYRAMDGTSSPHLSLASILIAGRLGIEQKLELKAIINTDPHQLNEKERLEKHILPLPDSLNNALQNLSNDEQLLKYFPKSLIETYFSVKRQELSLTKQFDNDSLCKHYSRIY